MQAVNKPYSESCEQNWRPILQVIQPILASTNGVLEIGSGTGQHAVVFASAMPQLIWHTSDRIDCHAGIKLWLKESRLRNVQQPIELDVAISKWPDMDIDAIFTANTVHIMHWPEVESLFEGIGKLLTSGNDFLIYGPFNYGGKFTSESNARFDNWLKERDPLSGIRNIEDLKLLADKVGLRLNNDYEMPANNRILHWQKL